MSIIRKYKSPKTTHHARIQTQSAVVRDLAQLVKTEVKLYVIDNKNNLNAFIFLIQPVPIRLLKAGC